MTESGRSGRMLSQAARLAGRQAALLLQAEELAESHVRGHHGRRRAGMGDVFWQFRPYHPGDMPRDIDWRQTAKRDDVFVREREESRAQGLWLSLDLSPSMDFSGARGRMNKADYAEILALSLALLAFDAGERAGALVPGGRLATQARALPQMQAEWALHPQGPGEIFDPLPPRPLVAMISDFFVPLDGAAAFFQALSRRQGRFLAVQVTDPAEEILPWQGRVRFLDCESEEEMLMEDVSSLRADYRAAFAAHRQALAASVRAAGGRFLPLSTAAPLPESLSACLSLLGKEGAGAG